MCTCLSNRTDPARKCFHLRSTVDSAGHRQCRSEWTRRRRPRRKGICFHRSMEGRSFRRIGIASKYPTSIGRRPRRHGCTRCLHSKGRRRRRSTPPTRRSPCCLGTCRPHNRVGRHHRTAHRSFPRRSPHRVPIGTPRFDNCCRCLLHNTVGLDDHNSSKPCVRRSRWRRSCPKLCTCRLRSKAVPFLRMAPCTVRQACPFSGQWGRRTRPAGRRRSEAVVRRSQACCHPSSDSCPPTRPAGTT